jgi:uncharacterized protein (DUF3820 family)
MKSMKRSKIIRACLRRDDYYAFKKLNPRDDDLPTTFDLWLDSAAKAEASLMARGRQIERVFIDPQEFAEWRGRTGFPASAVGREAFAIAKASGRAA